MDIVFFFLIFIWGCLWGSFTNVLVLRIPAGENWITKRSRCLSCNKKISFWHNIPIISYIVLGGKCSNCEKEFSIQYVIMELLFGIKSVIIAYFYLTDFSTMSIYYFIHYDILLCFLIAHVCIDFKHKILPDSINIIILCILLIQVAINGQWFNAAMGFTVGFGSTLLITYLFYFLKGQVGLGGGDIKLYGLVGIALGVQGVIQNLMMSSMLGLVVALIMMALKKMKKNEHFAFGPWIIIVFVIQLFFPNAFSTFLNL